MKSCACCGKEFKGESKFCPDCIDYDEDLDCDFDDDDFDVDDDVIDFDDYT